jgi:hypothetical protein
MTDKAFVTYTFNEAAPEKARRANQAVFTMKKLDIAELRRACAGG